MTTMTMMMKMMKIVASVQFVPTRSLSYDCSFDSVHHHHHCQLLYDDCCCYCCMIVVMTMIDSRSCDVDACCCSCLTLVWMVDRWPSYRIVIAFSSCSFCYGRCCCWATMTVVMDVAVLQCLCQRPFRFSRADSYWLMFVVIGGLIRW